MMKTETVIARLRRATAALLLMLLLGSCGLKDDLYIPVEEDNAAAAEQGTEELSDEDREAETTP